MFPLCFFYFAPICFFFCSKTTTAYFRIFNIYTKNQILIAVLNIEIYLQIDRPLLSATDKKIEALQKLYFSNSPASSKQNGTPIYNSNVVNRGPSGLKVLEITPSSKKVVLLSLTRY